MATQRLRNAIQLGTSPSAASVLVSDSGFQAAWMAPFTGAASALYYKPGVSGWVPLKFGPAFTIDGTDTLQVGGGGAGFYTEIQEEGTAVGVNNTKINFVGAAITASDQGSGVTRVATNALLNSISGLAGNGFVAQTGASTAVNRSIQGTANRILVTNGDGASANPIINIDTNFGSSGLADGSNLAKLNGNQTFTGNNVFDANIVSNASPTLGTHLVTKSYVDAALLNIRNLAVDVASTANLTLSGEQVIDGYTTSNSRVLVKDNTIQSQNGVWISASGAWTRATDMDAANEAQGALVIIKNGTQQGQLWYTVSVVVTLNTDPIVFTKLQTGVIDGSGASTRISFWADNDTLTSNSKFLVDTTAGVVSVTLNSTTWSAGSILSTKGINDLSSAFGYVHTNATGNSVFSVGNDGTLNIGSGPSNSLVVNASSLTRSANLSIGVTGTASLLTLSSAATSNVAIKIETSDANAGTQIRNTALGTGSTIPVLTAYHLWDKTYTVGGANNGQVFVVSGSFAPTSGSGEYNAVYFNPIINQTGTASGPSRALLIEPTFTSVLGTFTGLEINLPNQTQYALKTKGKVQFTLGSDAAWDMYVAGASNNLQRIPNTTTANYVLVGTPGAAPAWAPVPTGSVVNECFIENQTTNTIDLDANTGVVQDKDGNNISFTLPTNTKLVEVYLNGQKLAESGTVTSRDYSLNTTTHVITLTNSLITTDTLYIKRLG